MLTVVKLIVLLIDTHKTHINMSLDRLPRARREYNERTAEQEFMQAAPLGPEELAQFGRMILMPE